MRSHIVFTLLGPQQSSHEYLFWSYEDMRPVWSGTWKAVIPGANRPLELCGLPLDIDESNQRGAKSSRGGRRIADFDHAAQALSRA